MRLPLPRIGLLGQVLLALGMLGVLGAAVAAAVVYALIFRDLPEIYALDDYRPKLITQLYDRNDQLVGQIAEERRIIVPIEDVPQFVKEAFIAAEDDRFYHHEGLDYPSILRAAWANVRAGGVAQGGSTITQQVAKTFLLSSERTLVRKLKDMVLARRIEQYLQKNQILHLYLNQIYLGSGAYGIQAAAEVYFDKKVGELTLAEAALIAGLVPAPSRYTPRRNFDKARARQEFVLRRMLEQGFIDQTEHDAALAEEIVLAEEPYTDQDEAVAYFTEEVRRYLVAQYGEELVKTGGLSVKTTMDLDAQVSAYRAVRAGLRAHDRRRGYRGPLRNVPKDAWEEALHELASVNAEAAEHPGAIVEALVVEVDDEKGVARLALGNDRETTLDFESVSWAREPDPEWDGAVTKLKRISQALKPGYHVRLERTSTADQEPAYALFQEPEAEAALFSMDVDRGEVQAIVGGYSFARSQFDRAVQMTRQPGSAFKPIVYATAMQRGYTPASIVYDTPIVYRDSTGLVWKPGNYSDKFYGPITLRQALAKSRNIATVKVLRDIGISPVIRTARALGIERDLEPNLSLGLGASEVTLAELVRAYATFAANGKRTEPVFLLEVRDREGELLEERVRLFDALELIGEGADGEAPPPDLSQPEIAEEILEELTEEVDRADDPESPPPGYGLDPVTAYLMTDMLRAVVTEGTGFRAREIGRPTAGKTGTTNDLKDAWYIGFSPQIVAGVWVGYDEAKNLGRNETGSRAASPIFVDYAAHVLERMPRTDFPVPEDGIVFARIDRETGKIACPGDPKAVFQPFREGTVPEETAACNGANGSSVRRPIRLD